MKGSDRSQSRLRWFWRGLLVAGVACLAFGFSVGLTPTQGDSLSMASSPKRIISGLTPGKNYEVQFRIKNSSQVRKRIVGGTCVV